MPRTKQPAPIPDAYTGKPRPPTAPRSESTSRRVTPLDDNGIDVVAPREMGPPLEWCVESKRTNLLGAGFIFSLAIIAFIIPYRGFDWVSDWFPWCFAAVMTALFYRKISKDQVVAGARWVQQRDQWVSTYELTKIRSTNVGLKRASSIQDVHGNKFVLVLRDAQQNPLLWDLVYNGIVHSVTSGNCDISKAARRILEV